MRTVILVEEGIKIIIHKDNYDINDYLDDTYGSEVMWYSYTDESSIAPQVISLPEDLPEELSFGEHIDMINEMIIQDGDDVTDEECLNQIVEYVQKHFK